MIVREEPPAWRKRLLWIGLPVLGLLVILVGSRAFLLRVMSTEEEIELGREIDAMLEWEEAEDRALERYVREVGAAVAKHARREEIQYRFHLMEMPLANAFSLPGGAIAISTGLIAKMENEAELAGVLGHEIAHIDLRHSVRQYALAQKAERAARAQGGIGGVLTAGLVQSGYGRKQETEADFEGARLASRAGYNPAASVYIFQKIAEAEERGEFGGGELPGIMGLFASHPPTRERITELGPYARKLRAKSVSGRVYMGGTNLKRRIPFSKQAFEEEWVRAVQ